jgi:hypothetical protein
VLISINATGVAATWFAVCHLQLESAACRRGGPFAKLALAVRDVRGRHTQIRLTINLRFIFVDVEGSPTFRHHALDLHMAFWNAAATSVWMNVGAVDEHWVYRCFCSVRRCAIQAALDFEQVRQ